MSNEKTLGLDLGSNSIGWSIRNLSVEENQITSYGAIIFPQGVGEGKSGEYSFAAERTKNRSVRRLYQARKYRLWETLKVLIENDYCPLPIGDLNKWRVYDKSRGFFRKYPVENKSLDAWIKLDFNIDGKPDYSSPYQLRKELIEKKLDLSSQIDRYKLGRALYHIAQRRGFKSSRKTGDKENTAVYKGSKESGARGVDDIVDLKNKYGTLGAALAQIENAGERIRNRYTLRKHYQEEIERIFAEQSISIESEFSKGILKAIFYQRPLRSQKGLVGKCTLEPGKYRCPVSHPLFEEFRAWSFLNNIQIKSQEYPDGKQLTLELRNEIYREIFFRMTKDFDFANIRKYIEKKIKQKLQHNESINYSDKTNVSGCPVSARLKEIFGDDWKNYSKTTSIVRKKRNGKEGIIKYTLEDVWHILFSFEDEESIIDFGKEKLQLNDEQLKNLRIAFNQFPQGYSMLSLNAIKKILSFLREGFIYTEAVLLANMPEVLGEEIWLENKDLIRKEIGNLIKRNRREKQVLSIVNNLIARLKSTNSKFGYKDSSYKLDNDDRNDVTQATIEMIGEKSWSNKEQSEQESIINQATQLYQNYFREDFEWISIADEKFYIVNVENTVALKSIANGFYKLPHLLDTIKQFLKDNFEILDKSLLKLYHPSQIDIYPPAKQIGDRKIFLQSPKTGAFKNPMAMRTLHELRKLINYLIDIEEIDEDTRVVVELARELNDANKRWAIEAYQKRRSEENREFAFAIAELLNDPQVIGRVKANPNSPDDIDKFRLWYEQLDQEQEYIHKTLKGKGEENGNEISSRMPRTYDWNSIKSEIISNVIAEKDLIKKYRLWKEQGCKCVYTGDIISLTNLFDENVVDFEHTIPRSISFDNSLANLTVCFAHYNRNVKQNRIPSALNNYEVDWGGYKAIKPRLKEWEQKVVSIRENIEYWKKKSKYATDKEQKDLAIRQRHLWQFELDYWRNKLDRFHMAEVTSGFKNSQLVDTQIVSKYAFHYLKTVFNRVDVQKGSVTAEFRKIYGIQSQEEVKDRKKHAHHAIDAAVLTLIPMAAKREEILKKSFVYNEKSHQQYHELPYAKFKLQHIAEIEENIFINNIVKDQTMTPAKRVVRKRGKKVFLKSKEGEYLLDGNGELRPKIAQGDSIRGQLHLDKFYGRIKLVDRDGAGNPARDESGNFIFEKENEGFCFVLRKPVTLIKNLNEIVDPKLRLMIEGQLDGRSLERAFSEGVYMLNAKGEKVNRMRHIRCFTRVADPLAIKKQTYLSKYEYKQDYYSVNATSYLYALYEDESGKRKFKPLNLFNAAQIKKLNGINKDEDFFPPTISFGRDKIGKLVLPILKPGLKVLFYDVENKEGLKDLDAVDLSKRLYFIKKLFDAKTGTIQFQHHLEARNDKQLTEAYLGFGKKGQNGFSKFSVDMVYPRLLLSPISFNFLIERRDFIMEPNGKIIFK